jgi:hypothetical protein
MGCLHSLSSILWIFSKETQWYASWAFSEKTLWRNSSYTLVDASLKHFKWNRHREVECIAKSYLSKSRTLNEILLTKFCNVCPKLFCFYSRFSCAEIVRSLHCLCKSRTTGEPWSHFKNVQEIAPKDCLWGPPSLLFSGYRGLFSQGVKRARCETGQFSCI